MEDMLHSRQILAQRKGTLKRLHVDQHRIRQGLPAVTIQTSRGSIKCQEAHIDGPSKLIHSYDKPLSCGAKIWIETKSPVHAHGVSR